LLNERLSKLRKSKKLTQQDMADKLGITRQGYGNYESGKRDIDSNTLIKISDILRVNTDYLLGRTDNKDGIDIDANLSDIDKEIMREFRKLAPEDQAYVADLIKRIQRK